jgi:hypothetical protein
MQRQSRYALGMEMEPVPALYELEIEGQLDRQWSEWLEWLIITWPSPTRTLLRGRLADQSALLGVLKKLHNLGLVLVALRRIRADAAYSGEDSHGNASGGSGTAEPGTTPL